MKNLKAHIIVSQRILDKSVLKDMREGMSNIINGFSDFHHSYDIYRRQSIIKYKSNYDFYFGYLFAKVEAYCLEHFKEKYRRLPDADESTEINETIEEYYPLIRERLALKFKEES
jgi:hypothetical protein